MDIWREAIAILGRHPVFGIGGGALDSTIGTAAHNTYVSVATETGIIGFVIFLSVLGVRCSNAATARQQSLTCGCHLHDLGNWRLVALLGVQEGNMAGHDLCGSGLQSD